MNKAKLINKESGNYFSIMFALRKTIISTAKIFLYLISLVIILEFGIRTILIIRYKSYFNRYIAAKYQEPFEEIEHISMKFDSQIVMDPMCYYTMKGGFFRGPRKQFNPPEKEEGETRIICVGDSTTFGIFLNYHSTYPALLEELLQAKYPEKKIRVLNSGIPGASTRQIKRVFQLYLINYKPDIVIWRKTSMLTDTYEIFPISKQRILLWNFLYKSRLFRVICIFADKIFPEQFPVFENIYSYIMGVNKIIEPQYGFNSNFDIVKKIALDNGVKHVLAIDFVHNVSDKWIQSDYQQYLNIHVKPLLITFDSFKEALRSKKINDIFVDECHMTRAGTAIIASEIFKFIVDNGWVNN